MVGETDRSLAEPANNYCSATPGSLAGGTNQKLYQEQTRLLQLRDYLYLEFTDHVSGYNLTNQRDRCFAEHLLIALLKPYLQC